MTTAGTWYPPSDLQPTTYDPAAGTGGFLSNVLAAVSGGLLLTNPPFAMNPALAPSTAPPPDRFRSGDLWCGPDRRLYRIRACSAVRGAVSLVDATGRHELRSAESVLGFSRQRWGGRA